VETSGRGGGCTQLEIERKQRASTSREGALAPSTHAMDARRRAERVTMGRGRRELRRADFIARSHPELVPACHTAMRGTAGQRRKGRAGCGRVRVARATGQSNPEGALFVTCAGKRECGARDGEKQSENFVVE